MVFVGIIHGNCFVKVTDGETEGGKAFYVPGCRIIYDVQKVPGHLGAFGAASASPVDILALNL